MRMIVGHFQAVPENIRESIRVTLSNPYVIEGTINFNEFVSFVECWLKGETGNLLGWKVDPPNIGNLDWEPIIPNSALWNPLLTDIPTMEGGYLCSRLSGRGRDNVHDVEPAILASARSLQMSRDDWMREYLGVNPSPVTDPYVYFILPIAVGLVGQYEEEHNRCRIRVTYRDPYTKNDYWIRVGIGRWESSLPIFRLNDEERQTDGWKQVDFVYNIPPGIAPEAVLNFWVGECNTQASFMWSTRVEMKSPKSPEDFRRTFLAFWYKFAGQSIVQHVRQQGVGPRAKSDKVQDKFEVLFSNVCGALGYSVIFGGRALSTGGADFIAFDVQTHRAYVFSITVSNDVRGKLRTLILALQDMRDELTGWALCPLIVCQVKRDCFIPDDLRSAETIGIPILGEEDFEMLAGEHLT